MIQHIINHVLLEILAGFFLLFLFIQTGRFILCKFRYKLTDSEDIIIGLGLGFVFWSGLIFALGVFGLLNTALIISLVIIALLFLIFQYPSSKFPDFFQKITEYWNSSSTFEKVLLSLLFLHIIYGFFHALLPPTDNDGTAYHLSVPAIYLTEQKFIYLPWELHSNWPFLPQIVYLLGLVIKPEGVVSVQMHFFAGLFSAWALYKITVFVIPERKYALITTLFYITTSVVRKELQTPYIDLFTSYSVFAMWMLYQNLKSPDDVKTLLLIGLFGGLAASTKLTAPVFVIVLLLILVVRFRKEKFSTLFFVALIIGSVSFAVVLPWYVKSFIQAGNPFWPFAYSIFDGNFLTPELAEIIHNFHSDNFNPAKGVFGFFQLPFLLIDGSGYQFQPDHQMVTFLILICSLVITGIRHLKPLSEIAVFVFITYFAWYMTSQQPRFLIPTLGLLFVLFSVQIRELVLSSGRIKYAAFLFLCGTVYPLIVRFPFTSESDYKSLKYLSGQIGYSEYLVDHYKPYLTYSYTNRNLNKSAKIAVIGEIKTFYLEREYFSTNAYSGNYLNLKFCIYNNLKEKLTLLGVTHLIINETNLSDNLNESNMTSLMLIISQATKMTSNEGITLYEL